MNNQEKRWDEKEQRAYFNSVKFLISGNRAAYKYWRKQSSKYHLKWRAEYNRKTK